jgi:hypothetical protein
MPTPFLQAVAAPLNTCATLEWIPSWAWNKCPCECLNARLLLLELNSFTIMWYRCCLNVQNKMAIPTGGQLHLSSCKPCYKWSYMVPGHHPRKKTVSEWRHSITRQSAMWCRLRYPILSAISIPSSVIHTLDSARLFGGLIVSIGHIPGWYMTHVLVPWGGWWGTVAWRWQHSHSLWSGMKHLGTLACHDCHYQSLCKNGRHSLRRRWDRRMKKFSSFVYIFSSPFCRSDRFIYQTEPELSHISQILMPSIGRRWQQRHHRFVVLLLPSPSLRLHNSTNLE